MTWTSTKTNGSGRLRYRLMIEGWPEEWVTDRSITHSTGVSGRTVRVGLDMTGVQIHDRSIMHEARCEADGITFRIHPEFWRQRGETAWDDPGTLSFSHRVDEDDGALAFATTDMTVASLTMPTCNPTTLPDNSYYHIDTEVVYVTTWPSISARAQWGTIAQAHTVGLGEADLHGYWIYDFPVTMEGRRAYLYVYGDGDVASGEGSLVWRGIVRRPPMLDSNDGVTWIIKCDGITAVLKQKLAGTAITAKPVGIYHHADCAGYVRLQYCTNAAARGKTTLAYTDYTTGEDSFVGWHEDEQSLFDTINSILDNQRTGTGADTTIDELRIKRDGDGALMVEAVTNASAAGFFTLIIESPILGYLRTGLPAERSMPSVRWKDIGSDVTRSGTNKSRFTTAKTYRAYFLPPNFGNEHNGEIPWPAEEALSVCAPVGPVSKCMRLAYYAAASGVADVNVFSSQDATTRTDNPAYRIYVDRDMSLCERVYVQDVAVPPEHAHMRVMTVTASGQDASRSYYIEVQAPKTLKPAAGKPPYGGPGAAALTEGFLGFLGGESELQQQRMYGQRTSVFQFMEELSEVEAPAHANDGDVPFITSSDVTAWDQLEPASMSRGHHYLTSRTYGFYRAVEFEKFILEELKLVNWFMRIASDGRIDVAPLPSLTAVYPVDSTHTLTRADIITPAADYGEWPTWEPQRDGRISVVTMQTQYDPVKDEWVDPEFVARDIVSIAATKTRGRADASIKPYSSSSRYLPADERTEVLTAIAARFLDLFAKDYDVVRLAVPFSKFDVLCGDIVSVTHHSIPTGTGTRGVSGRRGVVIERRWDMDPSGAGHGWLTIMLAPARITGYAPSGRITAQTNTTANTWDLTLSIANVYNIEWSTTGNGYVLQHFTDGDYIRVVKWDDASSTEVTGVISGSPVASAGTCTVDLDGAWTPGADTWILEFQSDPAGTAATDAQRAYAYVASSALALNDGSLARRFS